MTNEAEHPRDKYLRALGYPGWNQPHPDDRARSRREAADEQRAQPTTRRSTDPICGVLLRLRALSGLSLRQVEAKSQGRWKAVVVGSYERDDRRPTVEAARELLGFYGYDLAVVHKDGDVS